MKSVIKYSILMICFSVSILLVMDINSISQRKSEMEDAAEISMRNSLKAVGIHKMYQFGYGLHPANYGYQQGWITGCRADRRLCSYEWSQRSAQAAKNYDY